MLNYYMWLFQFLFCDRALGASGIPYCIPSKPLYDNSICNTHNVFALMRKNNTIKNTGKVQGQNGIFLFQIALWLPQGIVRGRNNNQDTDIYISPCRKRGLYLMHVDANTISNVGKYIWGAEFGETEGNPNHGGRFLLSRKTLYES